VVQGEGGDGGGGVGGGGERKFSFEFLKSVEAESSFETRSLFLYKLLQ